MENPYYRSRKTSIVYGQTGSGVQYSEAASPVSPSPMMAPSVSQSQQAPDQGQVYQPGSSSDPYDKLIVISTDMCPSGNVIPVHRNPFKTRCAIDNKNFEPTLIETVAPKYFGYDMNTGAFNATKEISYPRPSVELASAPTPTEPYAGMVEARSVPLTLDPSQMGMIYTQFKPKLTIKANVVSYQGPISGSVKMNHHFLLKLLVGGDKVASAYKIIKWDSSDFGGGGGQQKKCDSIQCSYRMWYRMQPAVINMDVITECWITNRVGTRYEKANNRNSQRLIIHY